MKLFIDALLLSSFWFIALYTFKLDNIQKMAVSNADNKIWQRVILASKGLLVIWILLEVGLLMNGASVAFLLIRDVVDTTLISHLIYGANVIVLFNAAITMSTKSLESERYIIKSEKKAITFANGLVVLSISLLILFVQSVYWGEFNYIYTRQGEINLVLEALIDGFFILIPGIIILINAIRYVRKEKIRKFAFRISIPIILLLGFSQAILSKLIVLYDVLKYLQKILLKKLGFDIKSLHEDPLLIASSLSFGRRNAKINAYYLTSYFFAVVVLWTSQVSPFPIPSNTYENGLYISFYIGLAIFAFWIIENLARLIGQYGRFLRVMFIPIMILLTIYPFYTNNADISSFVRTTEMISLYHKMAFALGNNKYLFFLCLSIMQGAVAYILHLITGEAHNDRHHYSVLPIIFIVQVMLLAVMYPVFLSIPPYTLSEGKIWIVSIILLIGVAITYFLGRLSYHLFSSKKSDWSVHVGDYWKNKKRVYAIVGLITLMTASPLLFLAIDPIHNSNVEFAWENDFTKDSEHYVVTALIQGIEPKQIYLLENDDNGTSKLVGISTEDGHVMWSKAYGDNFISYKVWANNTIVCVKAGNKGFTVFNLRTGKKVYDYDLDETVKQEFLNVEVNDTTVLMTDNTKQTVYSMTFGEIVLDTLGNNFYALIPGNQTAFSKNDNIYLYRSERLEKMQGEFDFTAADYYYYDENGLIIFNPKEIMGYSYDLETKNEASYLKLFEHNISIEGEYHKKTGDLVAFYMYDDHIKMAYMFNMKEFTYKIITLEQRIKGLKDMQNIQVCDDLGNYFLYDNYQLSLFNNENLIARQWYSLSLNPAHKKTKDVFGKGNPLLIDGKIIWVENNGTVHAATLK